MLWWKVFYKDGSTYSSDDGSPYDAPRVEVQGILCESFYGGQKDLAPISGADYYYWEPEVSEWGWWRADLIGASLHLQRARRPLVLFGSYTTDTVYSNIEKAMLAEAAERKRHWFRGTGCQGETLKVGE